MDLDSVADELYALPPEDFTAARDAAAKQALDPALTKAIKTLRRPTAAAHAVNRIARDDPDSIDTLLDIGEQLRAAMAGSKGDVRRLTEERRELIGSLVSPDLPAVVREEVTATLEAATAEPRLGHAVRSGRLVKPLRYAGFGAMPDLADVVATGIKDAPVRARPPKPAKPAKPASKTTSRQMRSKPAEASASADAEKDRKLVALRQRVLELSGAADDAQRRYDEAVRTAAEARTILERAEAERAEAHKAAREAHTEAEKARRELGRLERS